MEGYKEREQVELISNLAQQLDNWTILDKVVFELVEFGTVDAHIGVLAKAISEGKNIDQCAFCGDMKEIVGTHIVCGEIYCAKCKEEEEANA